MFDVQDLIKKKLAELPPALLAELPVPRPPLESETVGGIGQAPVPVTENTFAPQVNNPANKFSQVPVIDEAASVEPQPIDFQRKMAGALEVQQPKSLSEQLTDLDQKDYSKGLYRRVDGTETSSPTTDGIPNEVVTPAGKDRDKKWSIGDKIASALIGFAQGGVPGAIQAGTNRNFLEQMKDRFKRAEILPKYQEEAARKAFETDQQKQQAQMDNLKADNERMELSRQDRVTTEQNKLKEQKRKNFYAQNKFFSRKNATEAQKRQLAEFGETPDSIGEYDFTKPNFKQIGDTTFKWDSNENAWVDGGLPKDKSKAFTEITAVDPTDGKSYTYVTTQEKAAGLLNGKVIGNMQIVAARDRQLSQQSFQASENEKNREVRREAIQVSRSRLDIANRNVEIAEQRLALAQGADKRAAQEELRKAKETRFRLKSYLKNNPLIKDDADLNIELDTLDDEP